MRLPFTETKTFNSHFLIIINFVVKQFLKHKTFVHCFHCDSMCTHERDLYKVVKHKDIQYSFNFAVVHVCNYNPAVHFVLF